MPEYYFERIAAIAARRVHIFHASERQHRRAHHARKSRYLADRQRYDQIEQAVAQRRQDRHGQQHRRYRHQHIDYAHQHGVHPVAKVARYAADDATRRERYRDSGHASQQRYPPAIQHPCQQIAPQFIRAQQMLRAWRLQLVEHVLAYHLIVRHVQRCKQYRQYHQPQHDDPGHRQPVLAEAQRYQLPGTALPSASFAHIQASRLLSTPPDRSADPLLRRSDRRSG